MKTTFAFISLMFFALISFRSNREVARKPGLPDEDRIKIAEAFRLADSVQDRIWANWSTAPFGLMLVTDDYEYLIGHPHATNNFDTVGFDADLRSLVLFRKRLFPTNLLATFPAINGISTIVVGQTANTSVASSTAWVVTILHEHFHQLQQSQQDYSESANALGLSGGDNTGMWMLDYPFPYDSVNVDRTYTALSHSLLEAIRCQPADRPEYLSSVLSAFGEFQRVLSLNDFKYFSFQCWQEGVARYTELRAAELASKDYTPGKRFAALKDYMPFGEVADSVGARIFDDLRSPSLSKSRRVAFYSLGAGEALLLDKVRPDWKGNYFRMKFHMEKYFSQ